MTTDRIVTRSHLLAAVFAFCACLGLGSCANYAKQWEAASQAPEGGWTDLTGAWEGRWVSPGSGHEGPLWCIITEDKANESLLHCRYRARWGRLAGNFRNDATIKEKESGGRYSIRGTSRLLWHGTFSLEAEGDPASIDGTYRSFGDTGAVRLRRPGSGDPESPGDPR